MDLPANPSDGEIGIAGVITCGGTTSSLDSGVFCDGSTDVDINGPSTIALNLVPGARKSDMRVTMRVRGQTRVLYRFMSPMGTLSSPNQQTIESSDSYEEVSFIIAGAAQNVAVKSIIMYFSPEPGCAASVKDICVYECVPG